MRDDPVVCPVTPSAPGLGTEDPSIPAPTLALLDSSVQGSSGGTLQPGEAIVQFAFKNKVAKDGHTIGLNFADGTLLDIFV